VLFAAGLFSHAFLYNFYLDRLGIGEAVMGGAAAALTAGGLTALMPAGFMVDRAGPRSSYFTAAFLAAVGLAAGAFAQSAPAIYAAAFLAGAGTATWRVAAGPLLMRLTTPATRERAFSWNVALLLASGALWTVAAGAAPAWLERSFGLGPLGGVRTGLALGSVGTLLSAALFSFVRGSAPVLARYGTATSKTAHPRERRLEPRLLLLILIVAVWMVPGGMVIPFFNLYFLRVHEMEVARIGWLFGAAQGVTAVMVFVSGDLAARFGARRMLLLWALPFGPLLWGLAAAGSFVLAALLYGAQGFVAPATNALIDQLLLERSPEHRHGAVSTARNAATELSGLAGAGMAGWLLQASSFPVLFVVAGMVATFGSIGLLLGFRGQPSR
jgi:MFS family permease